MKSLSYSSLNKIFCFLLLILGYHVSAQTLSVSLNSQKVTFTSPGATIQLTNGNIWSLNATNNDTYLIIEKNLHTNTGSNSLSLIAPTSFNEGEIYIMNGLNNEYNHFSYSKEGAGFDLLGGIAEVEVECYQNGVTFNVFSNGTWAAHSYNSWITSSSNGGTGNGAVGFTCNSNPNRYERTGTIQFTNQTGEIFYIKLVQKAQAGTSPLANIQYNFEQFIIPKDKALLVGNYLNYSESFVFKDAWGRAIQSVAVGAGPNNGNLVSFSNFDQFGRQNKVYKPFVDYSFTPKNNFVEYADSRQLDYYLENFGQEVNDRSFTEQIYDGSPFNEVTEEIPEGSDFFEDKNGNSHSILYEVTPNSGWTGQSVLKVTPSATGFTVSTYNDGDLFKYTNTDVDGNVIETYFLGNGNTVLTRAYNGTEVLNTYFAYDNQGRLVYQIPPKAEIAAGNYAHTGDLISNYCFYFKYNRYNLVVEKKEPGIDPVYYYYNSKLQLTAKQDGVMRLANRFYVYNYDNFQNLIDEGYYDNSTTNYTSSQIGGVSFIPLSGYTSLIKYFYNNYSFSGKANFVAQADGILPTTMTYGLLTGKQARILETTNWIKETYYYDDEARNIQVVHIQDNGPTDIFHNTFNFVGQLTNSIRSHDYTTDVVLKYRYTYDHAGRLLNTYLTVDNSSEVMVEQLVYNELGQVAERNLHSENSGASFLQSVDYAYNLQGWLTKINNSDISLSDDGDLFGMEMLYTDYLDIKPGGANNPAETPGFEAKFNGFVSSVKWSSANDAVEKGYTFTYDDLNRLTSATFNYKNTNWQQTTGYGLYSMPIISYDKNGNITSLKRNGNNSQTAVLMDNLAYTYNGNKLTTVTDNSATGSGLGGFVGNVLGNSYGYNPNGCAIEDKNRGITSINYNHLNLATQIAVTQQGTLTNQYSAEGEKTLSVVSDGNTLTTLYDRGIIYSNGTIEQINTPFGRLVPQSGSYRFDYHLTDYQGNTRVTFSKGIDGKAKLLQENHYYPFGLTMNGTGFVAEGPTNKYLYTQKEQILALNLNSYDFGARILDPAIGRWHVPDAAMQFVSPYTGIGNNPVNFVDPDGNRAQYRVMLKAPSMEEIDSKRQFEDAMFEYFMENGGSISEARAAVSGGGHPEGGASANAGYASGNGSINQDVDAYWNAMMDGYDGTMADFTRGDGIKTDARGKNYFWSNLNYIGMDGTINVTSEKVFLNATNGGDYSTDNLGGVNCINECPIKYGITLYDFTKTRYNVANRKEGEWVIFSTNRKPSNGNAQEMYFDFNYERNIEQIYAKAYGEPDGYNIIYGNNPEIRDPNKIYFEYGVYTPYGIKTLYGSFDRRTIYGNVIIGE